MKNIVNIIKIAKPLYRIVLIISISILITALFELISPILSKYIVDEIVLKIQHKGGNINTLVILVIISFTVNFLNTGLQSVSNRLGDHFSVRLRKFLTEKFYGKVLTLPQAYFDSEISGKIVNQLSRGITTIHGFLNTLFNFIVPTFLQSIFTIVVLAYYNIPIAIFTFILFPIYLILSYYSTVRWGKEEIKKNKIEDYSRGRI